MKLLPTPRATDKPPTRWQGLTDLRISLVSQGRFIEAFRFSTAERSLGTAMERYQITCLLLKLAMDHRAKVTNTKDEITWRVAMLQLEQDLGSLFTSVRAKAEAEVWLSTLEKELKEVIALVNGSTGNLKVSDSAETLTLQYCRLKILEEEPTETCFQEALVLGEKMVATNHIETERCHYLAIAWAKKLHPDKPSICTNIQFRSQYLFETAQRRVPAAVVNMLDILSSRATNVNEVAKNIEMLESFEFRFPNITLPSTKHSLLTMRSVLYSHTESTGLPRVLTSEPRELSSSLPTGYTIRPETSNMEANEQTLKFKDILERETISDRQFNTLLKFSLGPEEQSCPKMLKILFAEEITSGVLTEQTMAQLFSLDENAIIAPREELLGLHEQVLLDKLIGTPDSPLNGASWRPRRLALREWLLKSSRPDILHRRCLWIALHNIRASRWRSLYLKKGLAGETIQSQIENESRRLGTRDIASVLKSISDSLFTQISELVNAAEERIDLNVADLGSRSEHYGRETHIQMSSLPALYIALFFYSRTLGEEPSAACAGYLQRAEEVSRAQLAHWRSMAQYENIAREAIAIANIAQYRIECRIIKEPVVINQALEEALALLEEVEMLFGTTLHEIDLSHSLATLTTKVHVGNRMEIWTVGNIATRLLLHATQIIQEKAQGDESENVSAEYQKNVMRLWQWVQRVKARTLAQSMGLENVVPDSMLVEIQKSLRTETVLSEEKLDTQPSQTNTDSKAKAKELIELNITSAIPLQLLPVVRQFLKDSNSAVPNLDIDLALQESSLHCKESSQEEISDSVLEDIISVSLDLQSAKITSEKLNRTDNGEDEKKKVLEEELAQLVDRVSSKPALYRLLRIADFLNQEEALLKSIESEPLNDRYRKRGELQHLRQEMRSEPSATTNDPNPRRVATVE